MTFHNRTHRDTLQQLRAYVATAVFLSNTGWKRERGAHILVTKPAGEEISAVVVGQVSDNRLYLGPAGNFSSRFGTLASAKFQFSIGVPDDAVFAEDYARSLENLAKLQRSISTTEDARHLIVDDDGEKLIRLTSPLFEKRVSSQYHATPIVLNSYSQDIPIPRYQFTTEANPSPSGTDVEDLSDGSSCEIGQ